MNRTCTLLLLLTACPAEPDPSLLDPQTCVSCHPTHVQQWEGSMHAYASDDPVFRAMNAQAIQRPDVPGDFCVNCHAPIAVREGLTTDGTNLDEVPQSMKGVTCAFCHQLKSVDGTHNGDVSWSFTGIFGGGFADPVKNDVHRAAYDPLLARDAEESSDACGACHDVVVPNGLHLEKTYAEWQDSIFREGASRQGCVHCHLPGTEGPIATVAGPPVRTLHDHSMPAVDVALIPWPQRDRQKELIQDLLDRTLAAELCVVPVAGGSEVRLTLENVLAGHDVPSGSSHDRRMWVEVLGRAGGVDRLTSGVVPEGQALTDTPDPSRVELHDLAYTEQGEISHNIVDAFRLEERALSGPPANGQPHAQTFSWSAIGSELDQVDVRVLLRPIGLDVLQRNVQDGGLDPAVIGEIPTFSLGSAELSWRGPMGSCVGGIR
ncbi:MAG: multiheme c-type cytochrome [Myxococcota bacterium]